LRRSRILLSNHFGLSIFGIGKDSGVSVGSIVLFSVGSTILGTLVSFSFISFFSSIAVGGTTTELLEVLFGTIVGFIVSVGGTSGATGVKVCLSSVIELDSISSSFLGVVIGFSSIFVSGADSVIVSVFGAVSSTVDFSAGVVYG
jgi:hypothetical protein